MVDPKVLIARIISAMALLVLTAGPLADSALAAIGDQLHKLRASDAEAYDIFGTSVGISGNTAIVGASVEGDRSGSAYLFDVTTGQELYKLRAVDAAPDDRFGVSVGISGNTAIVGAVFDDDAGSASGSAYLFDVTTGDQLFKLTASDAARNDGFGDSVGVSGNIAIVGAPGESSQRGAAYLFDVATGQELHKLRASDAMRYDRFGDSVGISGNIAIVGAVFDDAAGIDFGSAYLFDVTTGDQLFKLTASDAASQDYFGVSVGISGNMAIIGADGNRDAGPTSGSAYLFDTTTGQELAKLTASDAAAHSNFGSSVAISGNAAIVGAWRADAFYGAAYLFDVITGQELAKLANLEPEIYDYFGESVGIAGNIAIVGEPGDNRFTGSAYLELLKILLLAEGFGR